MDCISAPRFRIEGARAAACRSSRPAHAELASASNTPTNKAFAICDSGIDPEVSYSNSYCDVEIGITESDAGGLVTLRQSSTRPANYRAQLKGSAATLIVLGNVIPLPGLFSPGSAGCVRIVRVKAARRSAVVGRRHKISFITQSSTVANYWTLGPRGWEPAQHGVIISTLRIL
jgi:hypothetical protein